MIILRRVQWLSAAALSVGLFGGPASADDDLCAAVQGLCASNHLASVAALKEAIGPEAAARVSAAEEALRHTPGIGRDATTSVAAGAALRDGQIIGDNSLLPEALRNNNAAAQTPPDVARFGRRPEADPLGAAFAGTQDRVRGNRQSSGTSGVARNSVTASGIPSRGSLLRNGSGPALDHSSPNEDGGVTRHTVQRDGTTTVTRTGGNEDGSSYVQTDTINPDGSESHTVVIVGGADNPGYRHMTKAERASPSELYTIRSSDSYNGGASWTPARGHQDASYMRGMNAYGPRPHPANNVDPDAPGGSSSPPACLFANPDCNIPLLIRFHENRPDRRGRPDESTATIAPRLRTDRMGTVVNPGLEGANVPGQGQAPESARSHDGGAIVNPGRDP